MRPVGRPKVFQTMLAMTFQCIFSSLLALILSLICSLLLVRSNSVHFYELTVLT